jgi:hypothetical protein
VRTLEDGLEVEQLREALDEAQVEHAAAQSVEYQRQSIRDAACARDDANVLDYCKATDPAGIYRTAGGCPQLVLHGAKLRETSVPLFSSVCRPFTTLLMSLLAEAPCDVSFPSLPPTCSEVQAEASAMSPPGR